MPAIAASRRICFRSGDNSAADHRYAARFPRTRGFGEALGNDVGLCAHDRPTRRLLMRTYRRLIVIHTREDTGPTSPICRQPRGAETGIGDR